MTKAELEEYAAELEGVIQETYEAIQDDDPDRALGLLAEYVEPDEETEEKAG